MVVKSGWIPRNWSTTSLPSDPQIKKWPSIGRELAAKGYLNERCQPFNPKTEVSLDAPASGRLFLRGKRSERHSGTAHPLAQLDEHSLNFGADLASRHLMNSDIVAFRSRR